MAASMLSSLTNKSTSSITKEYLDYVKSEKNELINIVERALGGEMSAKQRREFNLIEQNSKSNAEMAMKIMTESLKSSNSGSSNSSRGSESTSSRESNSSSSSKEVCSYCGIGFEKNDFDEYKREYKNMGHKVNLGYELCNMCGGTGKGSANDANRTPGQGCGSCNSSGWIKCHMCNGSGYR